jgi:hypothetical protein
MKIKANIFERLYLCFVHRESISNTKFEMTELEWDLCIGGIALDS